MIEVLRRSPAGAGCALVATAPTVADARALVANDAAGILLRDERGELYPAELPEVPSCSGGWVALRAGIWCLFFPLAAEMLDTADEQVRAYAQERKEAHNDRKEKARALDKVAQMHTEERHCLDCGKPIKVVHHRRTGPLRDYCDDKCATRARVKRYRAKPCNGVTGAHSGRRHKNIAAPIAAAEAPALSLVA